MEFDLSKRYCYYFNELSKIPRGSRNEKAASDWVVEFAKAHGLKYTQDEVWNVVVDKPASPGYEDKPPIILQGHLDMVCEKNNDVEHDFEKDPLDLYVDEEGWLHARGTTLGADDGYGIAYMMAILEDDKLPHPPLSCMFTVMEEIGLLGASHMKASDIHGKRYINLDGGGEVRTMVSSAGVTTIIGHCPISFEPNSDPAYMLEITGLKGGHSGGAINKELGNSNKIAARILKELQLAGIELQLVSFRGGMKFNAIPREAFVCFTSKASKAQIEEKLAVIEKTIWTELEFSDAGFKAAIKDAAADKRIVKERSDAFIDFLFLLPNGMFNRSMKIEGLTTSSNNAGVVTTTDSEIYVECLSRAALNSHMELTCEQAVLLGKLLGVNVEIKDHSDGWAYSEVSPLRDTLRAVLKKHDVELEELAGHGGLECGTFKGLEPDLDIITYGPIASGAHTPDEKLDLASFDRAYGILCEVLAEC